MKRKHLAILGILLLGALLLAPAVSRVIQHLLIETITYYAWQVKFFMRTVPEIVYWLFTLIIAGLIAIISILHSIQIRAPQDESKLPRKGPVQILAEDLNRTDQGVQFQWTIANRLAKLALNIFSPTSEKEGQILRNFSEVEWSPPEDTRTYLEAGLDSFMEFRHKKPLYEKQETPFDLNIDQVVEYLETEME